MRARLVPYHGLLRREVERFGGTVDKFIGDGVMAVFGAPLAHEDDPERAVRAGLRILEAIEEQNQADPELELQVRLGVMSGEAVVVLGGDQACDQLPAGGPVVAKGKAEPLAVWEAPEPIASLGSTCADAAGSRGWSPCSAPPGSTRATSPRPSWPA